MSREIKFRAWDPVDECMHYQHDSYDNEDFDFRFSPDGLELLVLDEKWSAGSGEWESAEYMRDVESAIFMQFTGLKDKNDVDIYEGDLLENSSYTCSLEVYFDDVSSGWFIADKDGYAEPLCDWNSCSTVIGNIHEQKGD